MLYRLPECERVCSGICKYEHTLDEPRFIDHGKVTEEVFTPNSRILEINSKSGLYPLYMAYSIYRTRLKDSTISADTLEEQQAVWNKTVAENIFVVCKTPMAKSITKRTLVPLFRGFNQPNQEQAPELHREDGKGTLVLES